MICLLLRDRLRRETVTTNALIPYVVQQGTEKYRTIPELTAVMENNYGSIFEIDTIKKGEEQILQFYMEFVNNRGLLRDSVKFLSEVMFKPLVENGGFKSEHVQLAKANARIAMDSRINNKAEYARLKCIEKMCVGEPFSIYGDGYPEDLEGLSPTDIYERYRAMTLNLPIEIFVVGNEQDDELERIMKEFFPEGRGRSTESIASEIIYSPDTAKKTIREEMDITQGKACVGLRSGIGPTDERFYSLMTANEILGGGPGSKLFLNAREKESLCYYINSQLFRSKGIVVIQSGTSEENFEKLISLIEAQLKKLSKGEVTEEEISGAKKNLAKKYLSIADYPSGIVDFYFSQHILGDTDDAEQVIKKIKAVDKESICESAGRLYIDTIFLLGAKKAQRSSIV